jgi:hypothetical protein
MMNEQQRYQLALERVQALRGFYIHLMVYVLVIGGLFLIDWLTAPSGLTWFYFPAVGWGIAVAIHAAMVFGADRLFDSEWEQRKVKELMERERR